MKTMTITTDVSFGINDLKSPTPINECPIKGCNIKPIYVRKFQVCPTHGLEIHPSTYIYYNGDSPEEKQHACLRNFLPFGRKFVAEKILGNHDKAESHRLGSENSEDALTWNIFGGLLHHKRLQLIYNNLTSQNASPNELKLYLWGLEIDFHARQAKPWDRLLEVRHELEPDIKNFHTEPDIMILGPTHLVCIEAKFTSGNPIALNKNEDAKDGEKPKSRNGIIKRYIRPIQIKDKLLHPDIKPEQLEDKVHSQLLRMIIFTSAMAKLEGRRWIVANMVSKTQWDEKIKSSRYDFTDPTPSIPVCVRNNFMFIYWEKHIYKEVLKLDPVLSDLSEYMEHKTANLKKAFNMSD